MCPNPPIQILLLLVQYTTIDINIFQTNDTICTDEEALMAQQVAMQLTGGLNVYNSIKSIKQKHMPYATTLQVHVPMSQIPQCIRHMWTVFCQMQLLIFAWDTCFWHQSHQISHNASICNRNVHTCAHFCYKMVHCGIQDWCIVGFVKQVYYGQFSWCLIRECNYLP